MKADLIRAAILALVLLGVASFLVFGIQHGFEASIGWFLLLLPGVWIAYPIADAMKMGSPSVAVFISQSLLYLFSFAWYFLICLLGIKLFRLLKQLWSSIASQQ